MKLNPSPKIRVSLYLLTALGTPLVAYLLAKGYIGVLEVTLWSAEVTAVAAMAGFNVTSSK